MVVKGLIKLGLVGGAVYWTAQQGIWGDAQDGATAGRKLAGSVYPNTNEYFGQVPSISGLNESVVKNWNTGVKTVFDVASRAPELSVEYATKAKNAISDLTKE